MRRLPVGLVAALALPLLAVPAPASAAPNDNCKDPGQPIAVLPWAQRMLEADRATPFATGQGVIVAVVDSGIDVNQPQLRGRVVAGTDLVVPAQRGLVDCTGHGTQTAGIIGAQRDQRFGFHGLAKDVAIISARVGELDDATQTQVDPAKLAAGINWAVDNRARVINIAPVVYADDPAIRTAIANARARDVVVVAAVGNDGAPTDANRPPFPASYPGVVGVGAIDSAGNRWAKSQHGPYVDLVAPGVAVTTTQRGSGLVDVDGTSAAAAFVSAAAALVRSRYPSMSAAEVIRRLIGTAAPAQGGADTDEYGAGVVDPYAAVTMEMSAGSAKAVPAATNGAPTTDPARAAAWSRSTGIALVLAVAGIVIVLCVIGLARALPMGRRRRWHAGIAPAAREVPDEEPGPPTPLFEAR